MKHNLFNLIFLVNFSLKLPIKLSAAVASGRYVQAMLLHSEKSVGNAFVSKLEAEI